MKLGKTSLQEVYLVLTLLPNESYENVSVFNKTMSFLYIFDIGQRMLS